MNELDEKAKAAESLLDTLYDLHGPLTPMVLTIALFIHCKRVGQNPEVHLDFGREWSVLETLKETMQ